MKNSLRYYREKAGITLAELAKKADIGRSTIGNVETGTTRASDAFWEKMAECLSIPKEILISPPAAPMPSTEFPPGVVNEESHGVYGANKKPERSLAAFLREEALKQEEQAGMLLVAVRRLREAADLLDREK